MHRGVILAPTEDHGAAARAPHSWFLDLAPLRDSPAYLGFCTSGGSTTAATAITVGLFGPAILAAAGPPRFPPLLGAVRIAAIVVALHRGRPRFRAHSAPEPVA